MDDDTSPFQPDELDELLSAELDGELEAAERDLGLSTDGNPPDYEDTHEGQRSKGRSVSLHWLPP